MEAVERLAAEAFDIVVVGGGVTGAGVARDAALRGMSTALVEAGDWAAGTSSRSTKFAHGGLRYLETLDFGLVKEALAERATLLSIAPHLARATPFLIPAYRGRARPAWELEVGLRLYDALSGRTRLGRHAFLDADGARQREPLLPAAGLAGAGVYWDARVRDARLAIETVADARRAGAVTASYCALGEVERGEAGWSGEVVDRVAGRSFAVQGRAWVLAAGPWSDGLRRRFAPGAPPLLAPTKGVHVVLPRARLPLRDPTALFASDGRLFFAVPDGAWTYVGTTDTADSRDVDDLAASEADVAYLLDAAGDALGTTFAAADVAGTWAGWRPLVRDPGTEDPDRVSREDVVEETAPGAWTIAGGKLTTYRAMAEEVVDRVVGALGIEARPCVTARRPLVPPELGGGGPPRGAEPEAVARARELFGPDADDVFARWRDDSASAGPLGADLPFTAAEVDRAAREMVETLDDLVDRRLLALPGGLPVSPGTLARIAAAAAPAVGWDAQRQAAEVASFRAGAARWPARPADCQ